MAFLKVAMLKLLFEFDVVTFAQEIMSVQGQLTLSTKGRIFRSRKLVSGESYLSNSFNWRSMGRSRFFIRIFKRYMAFLACSSTCFLAFRKKRI